MATPYENVESLTATIVDQTDTIFDQLSQIAADAISRATGVSAALGNVNTDIAEPDPPVFEPTLEWAMGQIEGLRGILLYRPNYPTYGYVPPPAPTLDNDPPVLSTVVIPDAPTLTVPEFTATMPDIQVTNPVVDWEFEEIEYSSELRDALYNVLLDQVVNGDYGINPTDEQRIWDRAREREQRTMQGAIDNATRMFTASGHSLPTGAAAKMAARIQQESREKVSSMNRELAVARGDLYAKMKVHTEQTTVSLEQLTMGFHGSKMDRALKAASEKVTAVVAIANFDLERIKIFLEKYKALAQVFETQARVEMVKADIFKSQVDAAKAEIDINKALLEEFMMRNKAIIDVYMAQIEEFKARIDGYTKYIGALADTYRADAAAYGAAVDGYGKSFDLHSSYIRGDAEWKAALLNMRIQKAKMALDEAIAAAQIELEGEKAEASNAAMIATGALSGLNVNAAMSANAGANVSGSGTSSESTSTNYNYSGTIA